MGGNAKVKRPFGVWIISILLAFLFLFSAMMALTLFFIVFFPQNVHWSLGTTMVDYYLICFDWGLWVLFAFMGLTGVVFLFRLRKQAYNFIVLSLGIGIVMTISNISKYGLAAVGDVFGLIGIVIGWGILFAICVYVKKLKKKGILV